jgi:gas vesicle protein
MSRLACFAAGLGIGVEVGFLFAPHAGAETRDHLRERADEARNRCRGGDEYLAAVADSVEPYGDGM